MLYVYSNNFLVTGEGMKVGALALLRNGCKVCVRTSCDSWAFGLKQHSILQEEVLTVFVSGEILTSVNISNPSNYEYVVM